MIVPSGKQRHQVNQGLSKNRSILDSDLFNNLTTAQVNSLKNQPKDLEMGDLAQAVGVKDQSPAWDGVGDAMNDSNSSQLNPDRFTMEKQPQEELQQEQPQQGPLDLGDGKFIDLAGQISQTVISALGLDKRPDENWIGKTEISNNGQTVDAITIKLTNPPLKAGPVVEKGGTPYTGGSDGVGMPGGTEMPGGAGNEPQPI